MRDLIVIAISCLIGISLAIAAGAYVALEDNDFDFSWLREPSSLFQTRLYEDIIVLQYLRDENAIYALLYFRTIKDFVPVRLTLAPNFSMMRQNAIVEDGVIVGATPAEDASPKELFEGTRGAAVMRLGDDGTYILDYLLIGDPFPRP